MMCKGLGCAVVVATFIAPGCGTPITSARIEEAIAPTFANLVHVQMAWLGLPPMSASHFDVTASCRRLVTGSGVTTNAGAGDWVCLIRWRGPDRKSLRDTYDLFVTTDGCFTATVAGENLGGPTLTSQGGNEVRNLLDAFEGCFDTT
jgi:hypothetical protein